MSSRHVSPNKLVVRAFAS